jgi:hypothetical protein
LTAYLDAAPTQRAVTLPTLRVQICDLTAELAKQTGQPVDAVAYCPDAALEAGFGAQPPVAIEFAEAPWLLERRRVERAGCSYIERSELILEALVCCRLSTVWIASALRL